MRQYVRTSLDQHLVILRECDGVLSRLSGDDLVHYACAVKHVSERVRRLQASSDLVARDMARDLSYVSCAVAVIKSVCDSRRLE